MARAATFHESHPHVVEALGALGVRNLVLGIQDPSFPCEESEDIGRGSPYSAGADRFLRLTHDLGFTGVQLGPQGQTTEGNPSPYDGTIFSKNTLSIALGALTDDPRWAGLVRRSTLESIVKSRPGGPTRVQHAHAHRAMAEALDEAFAAFQRERARVGRSPPAGPEDGAVLRLAERFERFKIDSAAWLDRDALYSALELSHGGQNWREWRRGGEPDLDQRLYCPGPGEEIACEERRQALREAHARAIERYAFGQLLVHEQHRELRERMAALGLKLYGDLQIGVSEQDAWSYQSLFLQGYAMGAPPSRTNPEGQPWNYPVLDPEQLGTAGAAAGFVSARMQKMLSEFDGVRVDHPHGLVCPWVYRTGERDVLRAVQRGARLFSSPNLPDHPDLARFAVVSEDQLNRAPGVTRYADDWVLSLTPAQIRRYSVLFDVIVASARANGRQITDLVCEVLSTLPRPLADVLAQYGLGRFRITQKANLKDPNDVYRSENAAPPDWIMVGNHDTKPIWLLLDRLSEAGALEEHAAALADRLIPDAAGRAAFAADLAADPGKLAQAKFAELFVSRAENVMVFFSDLFGLKEIYNMPGVVKGENWSLRLPSDYERRYREALARGRALNIPATLAMALRARGEALGEEHRRLAGRLDEMGRSFRGSFS
jgi:4-alpha-glucanotransferase